MFILHVANKKVQEKLCTEPKEPDQALVFAIAFEEGVKRQKAYGTQAPETTKTAKSLPWKKLTPGKASDVGRLISR